MQKGFTLIELLIVITVLSVTAVVMITILDPLGQVRKARDTQRKSDLALIQRALEVYYQDNGSYPPNGSCGANMYFVAGDNGDGNTCIEWGSAWKPYMNFIPQDPKPDRRYVYLPFPLGSLGPQAYRIYTILENPEDPVRCALGCTDGFPIVSGVTQNTLCDVNGVLACNYGVSSSNVTVQ